MIKKIFAVSYVANHGVRRICFLFGVVLAIAATLHFVQGVKKNFYTFNYKNMDAVKVAVETGTINLSLLDEINRKYFSSLSAEQFVKFFLSSTSQEYQLINKLYEACQNPQFAQKGTLDGFGNYDCVSVNVLKTTPIEIDAHNWGYLWNILWVLVGFYVPFILAALGVWVINGFKQSAKDKKK